MTHDEGFIWSANSIHGTQDQIRHSCGTPLSLQRMVLRSALKQLTSLPSADPWGLSPERAAAKWFGGGIPWIYQIGADPAQLLEVFRVDVEKHVWEQAARGRNGRGLENSAGCVNSADIGKQDSCA